MGQQKEKRKDCKSLNLAADAFEKENIDDLDPSKINLDFFSLGDGFWVLLSKKNHLEVLIQQILNTGFQQKAYQNVNAAKVLQGAIHDADTVFLFGDVSHHHENLKEKKQ